jgi:hypothetical protein
MRRTASEIALSSIQPSDFPAAAGIDPPLSERETELFWGLHGRIFYLAIRKFVYETPIPSDLDAIIRDAVQTFMDGAKSTVPKLLVSN